MHNFNVLEMRGWLIVFLVSFTVKLLPFAPPKKKRPLLRSDEPILHLIKVYLRVFIASHARNILNLRPIGDKI